MGRMNDLTKRGRCGQNLKLSVVAAFYFIVFCSALSSLQDPKGVKLLEVKKDGGRIILYEKSYALLIGVSEYQYECWDDLKNIPREMKDLGASLKKHGFIIQMLLNPTSEILKKTIEEFISKNGLKPNNRLLIFFSGHGYTRRKGTKGYILPVDTPILKVNESEFVNKAIDMDQILTWARKIESKHALFVFDSCFSGTIFQAKGPSPNMSITYLTGKYVREFITAGDEKESVPGKSCLVPYFIKGIEGEGDYTKDGYITGTELGIYLQENITAYHNRCGTPRFGKIRDPELDQGDYVFILKNPIDTPLPPPSPENAFCDELRSKSLIKKIRKAEGYYIGGGNYNENEALKLYREVSRALSPEARKYLDKQGMLTKAEQDYGTNDSNAVNDFYYLFKEHCRRLKTKNRF
jgi:hypothetical protein